MKRAVAPAVIALALFATSLTRSAAADPAPEAPPAQPAAPVLAPPGATPLPVRPSVPLALEPAPASPGFGWKIFALTAAAGCAAFVWKKRGTRTVDKHIPELRILGRTVAGPRCELLLVEIEGQRLLLGVTPQSVSNLYIIADSPGDELGADATRDVPSVVSKKTTRSGMGNLDAIEGQARGLLGHGDRS